MRPELPENDARRPTDAQARYSAGWRSTLVSVAVNIGLTIAQGAAGIISGSQALIADAAHSLSDLLSDFVVLAAGAQSSKDPDADHQYGHLRFETAASLVLGVLLLTAAAGMLWAALGKLQHPAGPQPVQPMALWVAVVALASKELLFRYMLAVARRVRSSMLVANAWHAHSDAASSLVVALGIAGNLLGYHSLDPIAAMVVALMVARMGLRFSWDALNDLMDRAADKVTVADIRATMLGTPGVLGLHDLRTRKMGDQVLVDVHLEVEATLTVAQGHAIAVDARRRTMEHHRVLNVMTHVDPVYFTKTLKAE
ncbi:MULTISPECIES: cation diffusion facilitator family transporter [Cupriavidus]|uniref:Co/Zn/Cd cation efflux system component n=3 Tax=Cupriavidus TaxID=106589 RepID=A0A375DAG4_9BURK|nr:MULTISPECIES: cation diffusion facilitator family transporter [Cupriavidus]MCO4865993.1 cation diffusion facilitator family transporter [Cupriavidus sp. WGlv3]MCO4893648.1 cation diffusion facilitator family transporter [Cupriavidus sp. WGtm5]ULX56168.1 cobalt transporter [Cupriavidus taiwanensis]CAP63947.1 Co/Zn/Cd cation efflux system component [Cupriavidus taiwanensis LMG 19424]SOY74381.1 Co/Zn/Cd cation efflux system component [Cupriavidus taiwanensis]